VRFWTRFIELESIGEALYTYVVMNLGFCKDGEILNKIGVSYVFRQDFVP